VPPPSVGSTGLELKALTNSCAVTQVQDFFQIINHGTTAVPLSSIQIKFWVDDTSGQAIVPQIFTGGCVSNAGNPSCVHQVSGVTVAAKAFSPACGPTPTQQANWEITISSTDGALLPPGGTWGNVEAQVHLANFTNFRPGTADWYSSCLPGTAYVDTATFALFQGGALVPSSTGVPPSCRAQTGTQVIGGNTLPPGDTTSLVGNLSGTTVLTLNLVQPLQTNGAPGSGAPPLDTFIQQVSDPTSPPSIARHYLKPSDFAAAYGPSAANYAALQSFVTANGLTVARTFAARNMLAVTGTAAAIEKAFFVTLNVYKRPDGTTFFAPANAPSANLKVPLLHVSGLDNFAPMIPAGGTGPKSCSQFPIDSATTTGGVITATTERAYCGSDFRNAYFASCASTLPLGEGQTVALLEESGYTPSDIQTYATSTCGGAIPGLAANFPNNITQEVVPSSTPIPFATASPIGLNFAASEVTLDMDMIIAMAPAANIILYESTAGSEDLILAQIADDNTAKTISNSYSWFPSTAGEPAVVAQVLQQFAAQGQSFFTASGDTGAAIPTDVYNSIGIPQLTNIIEPHLDSSLQTLVGGTELQTSGTGGTLGTYGSETTWNDPLLRCLQGGSCNSVTVGGFATAFGAAPTLPLPTYQVGLNSGNGELNNNPLSARMVPDVSWIADNLEVTFQGVDSCFAGTSAAAPLWASFLALVNEQATATRGPIGFANPTLYFLASTTASYGLNFHDISDGTNNNFFDDGQLTETFDFSQFGGAQVFATVGTDEMPGLYHAVPGYDLATGIGTPTCSLLTTLPPQSCMVGTSLSALVSGTNVTAYMPNGSYNEPVTGVRVVAIEGSGPTTTIATPAGAFINTCAGNSTTGDVVCTGNEPDSMGNSVYIINGTTIVQSLASAGQTVHDEQMTGGPCSTCNVAVDPLHNQAFISVGTSSGAAFQLLNLPPASNPASPTASFGGLFQTGQPLTSEDIVVDAVRGLILSPNELNDYQLVNTTTGQAFNFTPPGTIPQDQPGGYGEFDSAAEDCSTGIAIATDEFGDTTISGGKTGQAQMFLTDLNQAQFTIGMTNTWASGQVSMPGGPITTPTSTIRNLPQFSGFSFGVSGVAVDSNGSHLGVVAGEFGASVEEGGDLFGLIVLPSASVPGVAPDLQDWLLANIPTTPDGNKWAMGTDPHTLTVYTSPTTHQPYAIFEDDLFGTGQRTFLAVVDLTLLKSRGRAASDSHTLATPLTTSDTCAGSVQTAGCIVRFVQVM
jgi:hypothetical protein